MKKIILLISFFPLLTYSSYSQTELIYDIKIEAQADMNGFEMDINISRNPKVIKIIYSIIDSVNSIAMKKDGFTSEKFRAEFSTLETDKEIKEFAKRFGEIRENYEVSTVDSIEISVAKNMPYTNLIDSIYTSPKIELERDKEHIEGFKVTIHGTLFNIHIKENGQIIEKLYFHSPSETSHPLAHQLITNTLNLYRNRNPNSFLEKEHTNNY